MEQLISIIIPVYKVEKFLDRCIKSVVGQTYKNLEIILVDDGSPDKSPAMCDEWAAKDTRIRVIHKSNGGLSDARNHGLDVARGDYVFFLDSDDYIHCETIEKLMGIIKSENADFSMCGLSRFFEGEDPAVETKDVKVDVIRNSQVIDNIYESSIPYIMISCAKLFKKEIFDGLRYEKGRLHEDEFIIHHILARTKCFAVTNERLYYYYQHTASITRTVSDKGVQHRLDAYVQRNEFLQQKYPENLVSNDLLLMGQLRALYSNAVHWWNGAKAKEINAEYNKVYSREKKKSYKDRIFKFSKKIYFLLEKIRAKTRKDAE